MPTSETITVFQRIAAATGLSPWAVEIGSVVLLALIIVIVIYVVLAISRIRKELINLNLVVRYMFRMIKREIEGAAIDTKRASKKTEKKAPVEETKKEVGSDTDWKL